MWMRPARIAFGCSGFGDEALLADRDAAIAFFHNAGMEYQTSNTPTK